MHPNALELLKAVVEKPLTQKQTVSQFTEETFNMVYPSHVEVVKGKVQLTDAGKTILNLFKKENE